jgi:hypothetical protein
VCGRELFLLLGWSLILGFTVARVENYVFKKGMKKIEV